MDLRPALDPAASDETLRALIEEHSVREFIVQVIDTTFPSTSSFLSTDCRHREAPHHACCVSYSSIIHHIMYASTRRTQRWWSAQWWCRVQNSNVITKQSKSFDDVSCNYTTPHTTPHHTTHHTILEYSAIQHDTTALREPRCSLLAAAS